MKFKVGDKVIPVKKSIGKPYSSLSWFEDLKNNKLKYLYIISCYYDNYYGENKIYYACHDNKTNKMGSHFLESDLIPYKKPILKKFIEEMEKKDEK